MKILITGAGGFIGSAFVRYVLEHYPHQIRAFVRRTNEERIKRRLYDNRIVSDALKNGRLDIVSGDLLGDMSGLCEGVDAVVHAAAKTFVDHSIRDPGPFIESNTIGTYHLLEEARRQGVKRFIHVSSDEVYGPILHGAYKEDAPINPTNPYSASKAAADAIVLSYAHTFGMHTTITRTENNYGFYQHPQKVIPVFVRAALKGEQLPVYGDGLHVRQWLWVDDHIKALLFLLTADIESGQIFHVANSQEVTNIELACRIIECVKGRLIDEHTLKQHIKFIPDNVIRPHHDRKYSINSDKLRKLGWKPEITFENGISRAVQWYCQNISWLG